MIDVSYKGSRKVNLITRQWAPWTITLSTLDQPIAIVTIYARTKGWVNAWDQNWYHSSPPNSKLCTKTGFFKPILFSMVLYSRHKHATMNSKVYKSGFRLLKTLNIPIILIIFYHQLSMPKPVTSVDLSEFSFKWSLHVNKPSTTLLSTYDTFFSLDANRILSIDWIR